MSGPFRFNQQAAQSPLERVASPFSAGQQPVSYKTNVNRAKTQKWVTAKKNAYDGDDWGDYDEYDEYGVDESPQPEPAPLENPRYYGQRPQYDTPSRSFTDPSQQAPLPKARKNSFDAGEEQRSFSAAIPHPQQQGNAQPQYQQQPPPLQTGGMGRDVAESSPESRDFSPSAMPQPLQKRISTAPAGIHSAPSNTQFPPRKSSIGQGSAPPGPIDFIPIATSPRERTGSQDKPLPFIRPADIYKRVEEERRRESVDSSRPSLDSLSSRPKDEPTSPIADRRNLQPLETVAERKSEYLPGLDLGSSEPQRPQHDRVPSALQGISTFDNEFWSSGPDLQAPASHAPVVSPTQDQGFRAVVDQAFTRTDDQRSVPPTPISKDSDSELDRSNTGSTSGISPIMSRVPSSATAALKARNLGDGSTPVIAEEPHEAGTPVSRPTSGHLPQAPHAFRGHTRDASSTSLPRSGLVTPTRGDSPARSPAFGPQKTFPEPEVAQIATQSSEPSDAMEGGLSGPHSAYATREADIATAMLNSPVRAAPELSAAEKQSQDAFLESHNAQSPINDALPRDRSESPSKGRVQALAGKFGEVSSSRRGSTQSNISRHSVQSWERSQDHSRAPSPTKGSSEKPGSPKKEFRPHLPGGWESYAITTPAPVEQSEADKGLGMKGEQGSSEFAQIGQPVLDRDIGVKKSNASSALSDIDLTPTTKRRQATELETPTFDPISALKDAGAAMTESFRTTVGLGGPTEHQQDQERRSHGDVYTPRPLHMERTESALSSIPPTPPAKDTPESEFPPTPPLKERSSEHSLEYSLEPLTRPARPRMAQQLSTDPSADDQESDRLRKEIVASLSPLRMSTVPTTEPDNNSLRPDSKGADRASSILDSYYAELDKDSPRNSNDLSRDLPELAPLKSASSAHSATPQKPTALRRYSWEAENPQVESTDKEPQAVAIPDPIKPAQEESIPHTIERAVEGQQQHWNEGIPEEPYFGLGHTFTVTKPEPLTNAELAARPTTPPVDSGLALTSPPTREQTRSPGLHIVNSALDPEAVDLPPRWSAEHSPQPPKPIEKDFSPSEQLKEQEEMNPAISAHTALTGSIEAPEPSVVHEHEATSPASPRSPTSGKPLGAREIATIGSAAERIATYNKTRDQWATTDHGLSEWITATFEADPNLATQSAQPISQINQQSGTFRHKHTGSLAMLGKFTGSSNSQPSGGAYYEQYNSAAQSVPASSNSPTAGPSKTGSGFLGRTASHSIQTQQMQAKGKDLLHSAGVLSGKGMTSAKGLFAKGKSRFNRDKDSAHSREASRELESESTPTTTENTTTPTTADSSEGFKIRRRFSSPFRRSRSRARSASAAFTSTTSLVSTTSLSAVPTDVPDIPKVFQARPHSYHAPDLGIHPAYRGSTDQLIPTYPSHERGRAGVQASPTRTGFVTEREVQDDPVPPVPPLPAGIDNERRGRRSRSWGNASLMLQSAIRHATPPANISRSVGASPIITRFIGPERAVHEPHSIAQPHAPRNDRTSSSRTRHSSPITRGLWMGDTSPVLSKRTSVTANELLAKDVHQPVLPVYTDGTPAPADLVQLSTQPDETDHTQSPSLDRTSESEFTSENGYKSLTSLPTRSAGKSIPWPGTLLSVTKSNKSDHKHEKSDEAPLPQEFVMQFTGDVSPLLRSSRASLQDVSEDESGLSSMTVEQGARRPTWETETIGAGDVSDDEHASFVKDGLRTGHARTVVLNEDERTGYKSKAVETDSVQTQHNALRRSSSPLITSLHTKTGDKQDGRTSYESTIVGAGDVSPSSNVTDDVNIEIAPVQALDIQSALESRVIGADDVSPVSTRSSMLIATSSEGAKGQDLNDVPFEENVRPRVDKFFTAGVGFDLEPATFSKLRPDHDENTMGRPRVERYETAHEDVQGSSELTVPRISHPGNRYATVMASEPVATYKEYTGSSSSSSDDLVKLMEPGALTPQRAERADAATMPIATRRVSATQLQVVHAVEEYAASSSSLASWDQDSNAADAISEPGSAVEMKDESDLVTPVAQAPRNAQHGQEADQAGVSNTDFSYAIPNGYFNGQSASDSSRQRQQQPASTSEMIAPERSKSLLSIISSAVSSTPISPASSNAGRSTPSTIHRMQRDFSNAKRSNLTDVQILEEPVSAKDDQTPTNKHNEYDLYADHNGVVKDVRDENGQPLRVGPTPNVAHAQLARTTTGASSIVTVPDTPDARARRYSFERPMSFISGPQDDDGRPQDQINQPLVGVMNTPPIPPQSNRRSQQFRSTPSGAIYSNMAPMQDMHWPPGEKTSQLPAQPIQQPVHKPAPPKVVRQPTRFVPHHHGDDEVQDPPVQKAAILPPQRTPPSVPTERSVSNGQLPIHGPRSDQAEQGSLVSGYPQGPPAPRSVSAPLQQMSLPSQDPREAGQQVRLPPAAPTTGPRNEFEYQQQMMQLQAKHPRFRGSESLDLNRQQPSPTQQGFHPPSKPSSKPRLAAAIKGIVGRNSPNAPQAPNVPPAPTTLAPAAPPNDASRAESFVSAVSNTSRERAISMPGEHPGGVAGPQQPPSLGAEPAHRHVSHSSTQVRPPQFRQDPAMPAMPTQYQSVHPQQQHHLTQQQQHLAPQQGAESQNYRASTGAMPDAGKKKRFSAFTGLFNKGNAAADLQGKFKLSREEKKAQKAQRHTSQPILQSQPAQQWPPPHTQIIAPQQNVIPQASFQGPPNGGHAAQHADPRFMPPQGPVQQRPQGPPDMPLSQGVPQQSTQMQMHPQQQAYPSQQQRPGAQPDEGSAYMRTRQIVEEHQAREAAAQPPRPVYENPNSVGSALRPSAEQAPRSGRQAFQRPPSNGYYYPDKPQPPPEQGAYKASSEEHQRAHQLRQQQVEAEQRLLAGIPRSSKEDGAYGASAASHQQAQQHQQQRQAYTEAGAYEAPQAARLQAIRQRQAPGHEQGAYGATHEETQRLQQRLQYPLPSPESFGRSQIHYDQMQTNGPPQRTNIMPQQERQQIPQQPSTIRDEHIRQAEQEFAQHRWQQQQIQLRQFHMQQQAQLAKQQAANSRSVSGPLLSQASPPASPVAQRHVSSPMAEPEYDTPPIPGAYDHVQGVFVSPLDRQHHALTTPHSLVERQEPDPQMQPISPQVSAQSQMPHNVRQHSDASTVSVVSPISGPTPEPPTADQRLQRPRMPSISEVHQQQEPQQQQQSDRPWHMNFPAGTTEQDIVRARQKQFFQQHFASQQQAQAERHASSPSPRVSPDKQTPPFSAPPHHTQEQSGGFREVLPSTSPQPYPAPRSAPLDRSSHSPQHMGQAPLRPQEGSGWPLRSSPGPGPLQPNVGLQPPPAEPQTPTHPDDLGQRRHEPRPPHENERASPLDQQPHFTDNVADDAPPSYDGPGIPNDGMEKSNPERPRPPNIVTAPSDRGRQQDGRPRQASLGLMQHPQPASMAASPQRTAPDMGSDSLRRQMLQQEEHARMERIQRSQMQAAIRQREQQERDAARARAQELERSVSGGGRVGSLRSVRGSHNGGAPGWERRGLQGAHNRPVFELPALEDEEPVMRATSFPGQEWVPPMYVDE